jgi:hypothetical protein
MISLAETGIALRGIGRILRFDREFIRYFDRSRAGALRSFWMAAIFLPVFLLRFYVLHDPNDLPIDGRMLGAVLIGYAINWMAFPLVLLGLGPMIKRQTQVIGTIAVYNWLSLLLILLNLPIILLALLGIDWSVLQLLDLATFFIALICEGYILAVALQIPGFSAAALVMLDFVLGQIVFGLADRIGAAPLF